MATAPRRETLIALRARRTAHQIASALYLHQHCNSLLKTCSNCGKDFVPDRPEQKRCPVCQKWPLYAFRAGAPAPALWDDSDTKPSRAICFADAVGMIALFAVILCFVSLIFWSVRADLLRMLGH